MSYTRVPRPTIVADNGVVLPSEYSFDGPLIRTESVQITHSGDLVLITLGTIEPSTLQIAMSQLGLKLADARVVRDRLAAVIALLESERA